MKKYHKIQSWKIQSSRLKTKVSLSYKVRAFMILSNHLANYSPQQWDKAVTSYFTTAGHDMIVLT